MSDERRDWRLAYARGYNAAGRWPAHRPPVPPDPVVGRLVKALAALADATDGELAKFDPDDELAVKLYPFVDEAREALEGLGHFVQSGKPV